MPPWLLFFCFFRRMLSYLVFWENVGNFFLFGSHNMESLSASQKSNILGQDFVPKLFSILQLLSFLLLLHKPLLFNFLSYLGLGHLSYLLNSLLNTAGLCCSFQVGLELLLLFIPPLYLLLLFFKHLSIILGNFGRNRTRHDNTKERQKNFFFVYIFST